MDSYNKLVVNISSFPLSIDQTSVLAKGLNFCPTPDEHNFGDLNVYLDRLHRNLCRKALCLTKQLNPRIKVDNTYSEDELGDCHYEKPPFKHNQFKLNSTWNPTGPKVVEDFVFLNQEEFLKQKVFAPAKNNLTLGQFKAI